MELKSLISKREKTLIVTTLLVISLSITYTFLIDPLYKKYVWLNQQIYIKQVRLAKNLKLVREKDVITEQFKKYAQMLKTKGSNEEEMASVLSEIEKIGKTSGIYLSNVKPQKIKDMDFYKILLVEIKFRATTQTLSKFIYDLQNSTFLLRVRRLHVNIKGGGSSLIEGTIQISKASLS